MILNGKITKKKVRKLLEEVQNQMQVVDLVKKLSGGEKVVAYAINHINADIIGTSEFDRIFEHVRYELSLLNGINDLISSAGMNDITSFTHMFLDTIVDREV
tara:strand:+ start:702 stop:1007 length:306 start_codon:yes stop_codon:yes gene_type:complete